MKKDSAGRTPILFSPINVAILAILVAGVRLAELFPWRRTTQAGSMQNWRVELIVSMVLVICSIWIYRNRATAIEKLSFMQKPFAIMLWLLLGFTLWGALTALWAASAAAVALHTVTWLSYIAVLVFSLVLLRLRNGLSAAVMGFLIASWITGLLCFFDFISITDVAKDIGTHRIKYARFAECFLTITPLLCIWVLYVRGTVAILATLAGWLLGWTVVMLSLSKGALLAGVIGHVVVFIGCALFTKQRIRSQIAFLAGVWLIVTLFVQIAFSVFSAVPTTTEYISGDADTNRSTSIFRIFSWEVGLHMAADNPVVGVGANNFGIAFDDARAAYHANRPDDITPEIAEDYLPERAHNEFLQIVAEEGVIGILLFAAAFLLFAFLIVRSFIANRYTFSPLLWAALAGMTAFFASSFVSSFSFRIVQNGVYFFIIFALATNELIKLKKIRGATEPAWVKALLSTSVAGVVLMFMLLATRAYADLSAERAANTANLERALPYYSAANFFDPDNVQAYAHAASRLAARKQFAPAADALQTMIDRGGGTSLIYSQLAHYQTELGDHDAAGRTLAEAVAVYSNSVFMRIRYAAFLEERNRQAEANEQKGFATRVDPKQADGWYGLIKSVSGGGSKADRAVSMPEGLLPNNARNHYMGLVSRSGGRIVVESP